jgi:hypothetical protein
MRTSLLSDLSSIEGGLHDRPGKDEIISVDSHQKNQSLSLLESKLTETTPEGKTKNAVYNFGLVQPY